MCSVDVGNNLVLVVAYKHTHLAAVAQTVRGQEFCHILCIAHLLARLIVGVEHMAVEGIEPQSALHSGAGALSCDALLLVPEESKVPYLPLLRSMITPSAFLPMAFSTFLRQSTSCGEQFNAPLGWLCTK